MQNSNNTSQTPPRRLYRSRTDRMLAGVCGGLAEYANMDSALVRILFVILTFMGGVGLVLYIVGIIIIPENPNHQPAIVKKKEKDRSLFWGALLIIFGSIMLLNQMDWLPPLHLWELPWHLMWAILLIVLGLFLLLKTQNEQPKNETFNHVGAETSAPEAETSSPKDERFHATESKSLFRSRTDRMIAGVCGGLAEYFNIDPTIVRLLYVILTLFSKGLGILAYIILILAIPEKKENEV